MSFKSKVLAAAATLTMVGGVGKMGVLAAGTAGAATLSNALAAAAALTILSVAAILLAAMGTGYRVGPLLATAGCRAGLHPAARRVSVATGRPADSGGMRR